MAMSPKNKLQLYILLGLSLQLLIGLSAASSANRESKSPEQILSKQLAKKICTSTADREIPFDEAVAKQLSQPFISKKAKQALQGKYLMTIGGAGSDLMKWIGDESYFRQMIATARKDFKMRAPDAPLTPFTGNVISGNAKFIAEQSRKLHEENALEQVWMGHSYAGPTMPLAITEDPKLLQFVKMIVSVQGAHGNVLTNFDIPSLLSNKTLKSGIKLNAIDRSIDGLTPQERSLLNERFRYVRSSIPDLPITHPLWALSKVNQLGKRSLMTPFRLLNGGAGINDGVIPTDAQIDKRFGVDLLPPSQSLSHFDILAHRGGSSDSKTQSMLSWILKSPDSEQGSAIARVILNRVGEDLYRLMQSGK